MERIYLTENEKKILIRLYEKVDHSDIDDVTFDRSITSLQKLGLVRRYANYREVRILPEGIRYIEWNPDLKNPVDKDEETELTINELKYNKSKRFFDIVNGVPKFVYAIIFIAALLLVLLKLIKSF